MNQTDYYLCLLLLFENVRNILSCTRGLLYFRPAILAINFRLIIRFQNGIIKLNIE